MWARYLVLTVLLLTDITDNESAYYGDDYDGTVAQKPSATDEISDLVRCRQKLGYKFSERSQLLSNIVGIGWDNLRNLPMANVYDTTFHKCKTTPDGLYIVPDNVVVMQVKKSHMDNTASFYGSFQSYFHSTTYSVNVEASANLQDTGSVSGSFSYENQRAKQNSVQHSSSIFKTKVEYHAYTLVLQANSKLSDGFRKRLEELEYIRRSKTDDKEVQYAAQLLVRDYGTHIITRAKIGAEISSEDYIDTRLLNNSEYSLDEVKAKVSADFKGMFKMSVESSHRAEEKNTEAFENSLRHSVLRTRGGPTIRKLLEAFINQSAKIVSTSGADSAYFALDEVVPLDRGGEPLHQTISHRNTEGIDVKQAANIAEEVQRAIKEYYKQNTLKGCMDPKSPSYNPIANEHDNSSCTPLENKFALRGFYQECAGRGCSDSKEDGPMFVINGISGQKWCPDPPMYSSKGNSLPILILSTHTYNEKGSWLWGADAFRTLFLCYVDDLRMLENNTGYMFGGMYSPEIENPFTGEKSCPPYFLALKMIFGITACLSRNYDLGSRYARAFGGMISCITTDKSCPENYTNYYVRTVVDDTDKKLAKHPVPGCEIYFCAKPADLPTYLVQYVKRPPFIEAPGVKKAGNNTDDKTFLENYLSGLKQKKKKMDEPYDT